MEELWKPIEFFPDYSVSTYGRVRNDKLGHIIAQSVNQDGVSHVGIMRDHVQRRRSVPLLVAKAFIFVPSRGVDEKAFDTPINLDGDRTNNHVDNIQWRPRWYAIKYNNQFRYSYDVSIDQPVVDLTTGEVSENSFECGKRYGLLEEEVASSILNRTYAWPTYQEFGILEE